MNYLAIKNWRRYQHYTQRKAPWVKLYGDLLDDAAFLALSESAQLHLVKLWALVAKMGHPLPNNPPMLAGKIGAKRLRITELLAAGFIYYTDNEAEGCEQNASNGDSTPLASPLANGEQNARDSTRAREEVRSEKRETPRTTAHAREGAPDVRLDEPNHRAAYVHYRGEARVPDALDRELVAIAEGMSAPAGRPVPWSIIGQALHEMLCKSREFSARSLRNFITDLQRGPEPAVALSAKIGRKLTTGEAAYLQGLSALGVPAPAPA